MVTHVRGVLVFCLIIAVAMIGSATVFASDQDEESDTNDLPADVDPQAPGAMLGILMEPVPTSLRKHLGLEKDQGVLVQKVLPGTPAAEAGIQESDIILARMDETGAEIALNPGTLQAFVAAAEPGDELRLKLLRAGHDMTLDVRLAHWDHDIMPAPWHHDGWRLKPLDEPMRHRRFHHLRPPIDPIPYVHPDVQKQMHRYRMEMQKQFQMHEPYVRPPIRH